MIGTMELSRKSACKPILSVSLTHSLLSVSYNKWSIDIRMTANVMSMINTLAYT
jgi:hypothetical protein